MSETLMHEGRVRTEYDRLAAVYDQRWPRYITQTLSLLQRWAALPPDVSVLDVGCGTGVFEQRVLAQQPRQRIAGVDLSRSMLAVASRRCAAYPTVGFHAASVAALPFADNSFDVVVSASAFHYFADPFAALAEIKRVLKPGSELVILDWCRDYLACKLLDAVLQRRDPAHRRTYTKAELHHMLQMAGFQVVRSGHQRCDPLWGMMIATARSCTD